MRALIFGSCCAPLYMDRPGLFDHSQPDRLGTPTPWTISHNERSIMNLEFFPPEKSRDVLMLQSTRCTNKGSREMPILNWKELTTALLFRLRLKPLKEVLDIYKQARFYQSKQAGWHRGKQARRHRVHEMFEWSQLYNYCYSIICCHYIHRCLSTHPSSHLPSSLHRRHWRSPRRSKVSVAWRPGPPCGSMPMATLLMPMARRAVVFSERDMGGVRMGGV